MENQTENTVENKGQEDKSVKNYDAVIKKLVAIVGGTDNLFPIKKVENDVVASIVTGLLKEKKENLEKEIKADLIGLLDKHVVLKREIKAKEDELKKLSETKMKEFTEAATKVFGKIGNINQLETEYYSSLKSISPDSNK